MKIDVDFESKTLTIYDNTNLQELVDFVNQLGIDLKEWTIVGFAKIVPTEITKVIVTENPYYIPYTRPSYPWENPIIY